MGNRQRVFSGMPWWWSAVQIVIRPWIRRWRSVAWLALGLAIALIVRFPDAAIAQTTATTRSSDGISEIRGVWLTNVDSDVLFAKDSLRQAIRRLARLNFNTVYPTVWNGGYTLYPSQVAKAISGVEVDPEMGDRDMLEEAIDLGHSRGLTVIPWFEFGLMAPADSELVQRHPDWVTSRRDGKKIFNVHGEDRSVWLTPAHPDVQQFLVDLITEAVTKYDLDGIQLDDHFGMPVDVGYDPYTIGLYQLEHNGRKPSNNPQDAEWMRWRASKLSDLMVKIYTAIKTHKPDCIISLSPNPKGFAYQRYLQDWFSWQRLGFLDELIVQVYRSDMQSFATEISGSELQALRQRLPVGIGILAGLSARNVQMGHIVDQVELVRERQFAGISFFFYETLGNRDASFQSLFPNPASRPNDSQFNASS